MPLPNRDDVHVNRYLTDISVAFAQDSTKFIADQVFPRIGVMKKSDYYAIYDQGDFMRDEMQVRTPGTESVGGGYRLSRDQYLAERYAYHVDVDDDTVANQDDPFNAARDAAIYLAQKDLIKRDTFWCTKFFTTGVWTGGTKVSGASGDLVASTDFLPWDDVASTPIENVSDQIVEVETKTGLLANTLVINRRGWMSLKNHPDIVDRVKFTSSDAVSMGIVARLMDLDRIIVAGGVSNTSQEGLTASYGYIVGNHALLCFSTGTPGLMQPTAGYTFTWTPMGGAAGTAISEFRHELIKSTRYEIEANWDMKVVTATAGCFFQNIVS